MKKIIKFSLSFMWIFTGFTSLFWAKEIGYEILLKADIKNTLADVFIYGGGMLDIMVGIWLLTSFQIRKCCVFQIIIIAVFTIFLSFIDPSFWLHPFGAVTKNIPVIVLVYVLFKLEKNELFRKS